VPCSSMTISIIIIHAFAPIVSLICPTVWYIMERLQIIAIHLKTYGCQWHLYRIRRGLLFFFVFFFFWGGGGPPCPSPPPPPPPVFNDYLFLRNLQVCPKIL
jgi:hypothetical protein